MEVALWQINDALSFPLYFDTVSLYSEYKGPNVYFSRFLIKNFLLEFLWETVHLHVVAFHTHVMKIPLHNKTFIYSLIANSESYKNVS